jgi:ribonuclease P protein subunit RPR2
MDIRRKKVIKASVRSSLEKLLSLASKAYDAGKKERSDRYVKMSMDLLKKHKIKLQKELKNSFCRKCLTIWIPGKTVTAYYDRKTDCLRVRCNRCGYSKRL